MHVDRNFWVLLDQSASCSGMIEVDMSEQNCFDVANGNAVVLQLRTECGDTRSGTWVNQYYTCVACVDACGDGLRRVAEIQIDVRGLGRYRGHAESLSDNRAFHEASPVSLIKSV